MRWERITGTSHRAANPLDVPEQCCGLSLPTHAQEDRHHGRRSALLCTPPAGDKVFGLQGFVPASAVGRKGTVRSFTVSLSGSTPSSANLGNLGNLHRLSR